MRFEIMSRLDRSIKFAGEFDSWRQCVEAALKSSGDAILRGAYLRYADLHNAVLRGADLSSADLSSADLGDAIMGSAILRSAYLHGTILRGADLSSADLRGADLYGADLSSANLSGADLRGAHLSGANLSSADLSSADLSGADLRGADLSSADLSSADLTEIRDDFRAILSGAPAEVHELIRALKEGRVNGSQYEGECACLIGTIANARGCHYREIPTITPNVKRPAEAFFTAIRPGDTPEKNMATKIAVEWAEDWLKRMREAFAVKQV